MREPEAAGTSPIGHVPGGVFRGQGGEVGYEGLVLDDEGNAVAVYARACTRKDTAINESVFHGIRQQIARRLTRIDVQTRDAVAVIVIEHQPATLLVGPVVGAYAIPVAGRRIDDAHVRHVLEGGTFLVGSGVPRGRDPLVWRAVTDPGRDTTMKMKLCAVLRVQLRTAQGPGSCAHRACINRQEQIAAGSGAEHVDELDPHRAIPPGDDQRAQVVGIAVRGRCTLGRIEVHVASQLRGGRQVRVKLLGVIRNPDLVVIRVREGGCIRVCDGNVVPQFIGIGRTQTRQPMHELPEERAVGVVGNHPTEVVDGTRGTNHDRGAS